MAQTTTATLQVLFRAADGIDIGSPDSIEITQEDHDAATYSRWYCVGKASKYQGRSMWVRTAVSGSAATQAAGIIATLTANTTFRNGNVDPNVGP